MARIHASNGMNTLVLMINEGNTYLRECDLYTLSLPKKRSRYGLIWSFMTTVGTHHCPIFQLHQIPENVKGRKTSRHCNCRAANKHLTDIENTPNAYRDQGRTFYTTLAFSP